MNLASAEQEELTSTEAHDLTPAEAAAIAAGEMLPDDVEPSSIVGEHNESNPPLESHEEASKKRSS